MGQQENRLPAELCRCAHAVHMMSSRAEERDRRAWKGTQPLHEPTAVTSCATGARESRVQLCRVFTFHQPSCQELWQENGELQRDRETFKAAS